VRKENAVFSRGRQRSTILEEVAILCLAKTCSVRVWKRDFHVHEQILMGKYGLIDAPCELTFIGFSWNTFLALMDKRLGSDVLFCISFTFVNITDAILTKHCHKTADCSYV
jgi:hypothetical protein